jgi:hypothetical protein
MKTVKKIAVALSVLGLALLVAGPALAINIPTVEGISSEDDVPSLIVKIIQWVLIFVGSLALLFLIIAGLMYITSQGNEERIGAAKKTMIYSIVGLAIALVSYVILAWINSTLLS